MIICSVNHIGKMYGGNSVFEDISFEINSNDRVGLVGRNGSGKSTLFRLMSGEETPDSGQIHWKKGLQIGYLKQIPSFLQELTTKEVLKQAFADLLEIERQMNSLETAMGVESNPHKLQQMVDTYGHLQDQFTGRSGYEMDSKIDKVAHGLNISGLLDRNFSDLSGGEKTKVGLGLILLQQPEFLLLDEPTNHLDLMAVEWLGDFLKEYEGTVVIVSHDRYFLDEVVNKILDLEDGEITCYHANFSCYVKEKEERLLREFQAYEEQQKKIKKMKEAIKRLREWANNAKPPNADLHKRARNMERALERMEKLQRPILNRKKMGLEMDASGRSGKDVISLTQVSKSYDGKQLFSGADMHLMYQQRAAVIGENGKGKSTLLKLILQEVGADKGKVRIGSNVKIGYLSQQLFTGIKDETVIELFRNEVMVAEGEARQILAKFLFYGHMVFRKVSQLSGGERMRLRLAQLMHQNINLLILDEPTNHLDIESREVLEEVLEDYDGTILAVSHDRYFLNKLFDKIYWIEANKLHCFEGNYQWAKTKMEEKRRRLRSEPADEKKTYSASSAVENRTIVDNKAVEKDMEQLERKIAELAYSLSVTEDLDMLQEIYQEKKDLERRWERLFEQLI
ncbi:ribosomal protection-like ABC-F family protein [Sediminibacillus massiliensis]|uniref:ribosomal protection-like ABC-F family protein n=1 Tax=Sediminibacillus massiliensis TaxID=1926277 RepID=UPI0009886801|nr:ABC-F type ribosomal protection protein [Sediminibacillus massiliensis]